MVEQLFSYKGKFVTLKQVNQLKAQEIAEKEEKELEKMMEEEEKTPKKVEVKKEDKSKKDPIDELLK